MSCNGDLLTIAHMDGYYKGRDSARKDLEFMVYHSLDPEIDEPIISISRGREMLGFKTMDEMRNWRDNYQAKEQTNGSK